MKKTCISFMLMVILLFSHGIAESASLLDNPDIYTLQSRSMSGIVNNSDGYRIKELPLNDRFLSIMTGLFALEINTCFQYGELPFSVNTSDESITYYLGLDSDRLILFISRKNDSIDLFYYPDKAVIICMKKDYSLDDETVAEISAGSSVPFYKFSGKQINNALNEYFNMIMAQNTGKNN